MAKIKGCSNVSCQTHQKKITYKESEAFCSKCGTPLIYVCKDCYTQLSDGGEKYCVRCRAQHEDRKDKRNKIVVHAGGAILALGTFALTIGKKALSVVKNLKG